MDFISIQFTYKFLFRTYRFDKKCSTYFWKEVWEEFLEECREYFVGKSVLHNDKLVEIYDLESFDGEIHLNVMHKNGIGFRLKLTTLKSELYD